MESLKDIKEIVEVTDNSLWQLIGTIFISLILILLLLYLIKKLFFTKKRKKLTPKDKALITLKNIDYNDTKEIAYTFTQNMPYFLNQNNQEKFNKIEKELEIYKYKREVPKMEEKLKERIKEMIKEIK